MVWDGETQGGGLVWVLQYEVVFAPVFDPSEMPDEDLRYDPS